MEDFTEEPFSRFRTARTTRAPAPPSARAVARPIPLVAPVTITVRPVILGMEETGGADEVMSERLGSV